MSSNKVMVPQAKDAMERFKMEAANEVGVNLKQGYNPRSRRVPWAVRWLRRCVRYEP